MDYTSAPFSEFIINPGHITTPKLHERYGLETLHGFDGRLIICPARFLGELLSGALPLEGRYAHLAAVTHVLDVERGNHKLAPPFLGKTEYRARLFNDADPVKPWVVTEGVHWLRDALREDPNNICIVSCAAGMSRSPSIATAVLYSCLADNHPDPVLMKNCLAAVCASRPGAMPHIEIWNSLMKQIGVDLPWKEIAQISMGSYLLEKSLREGTAPHQLEQGKRDPDPSP